MVQGSRRLGHFRPPWGVPRAVLLKTQVDGHLDRPGVTWGHGGIHLECACPWTRCTPSPRLATGPCPLGPCPCLPWEWARPFRPRSLPPFAGLSHWVCQTWVQGLPQPLGGGSWGAVAVLVKLFLPEKVVAAELGQGLGEWGA